MKLATFTHDGSTRVGVVVGEPTPDGIIDLAAAVPDLPREMVAFLEAGQPALAKAQRACGEATPIPLADVRLEAPIARPPKFLAVGLNYADHVAEAGLDTPENPTIFNKQSTCVVGPTDPVHVPRASHVVDYEGELGFVIGQRCRNVSRDDAVDAIAGYLVVNDVTVRDWQLRTPTWTMGKSFDTHGPIGPWIVTTADEIPESPSAPAPHLRERRAPPGLEHEGAHLRLLSTSSSTSRRPSPSSPATSSRRARLPASVS